MPANIKELKTNSTLKHSNKDKRVVKFEPSLPTKSLEGKYVTPTFFNEIKRLK